jgi:hypothetical protein
VPLGRACPQSEIELADMTAGAAFAQRVREAMNLMTRGNQTRHQLLADRSRRTSHKHSHQWLLDRGILHTPYDETAAPAVTPEL